MALTIGSLFSGIGGIELGFERTGEFRTIWFCENDPYASAVLEKNFPGVINHDDIKKTDWSCVQSSDVLTGGFPCQDISVAGKGKGIKEGTRSGLWLEFLKAIRTLRPRYAVIENVSALALRGLDIVLVGLAEAGYDAEWFVVRASDVGAPHRRERLFIIAHRNDDGASGQTPAEEGRRRMQAEPLHDADPADPRSQRTQGQSKGQVRRFPAFSWCEGIGRVEDLFNRPDIPEPLVCGADDGISRKLDNAIRRERTKCIGNSVVPQVAQVVAERVLELDAMNTSPASLPGRTLGCSSQRGTR